MAQAMTDEVLLRDFTLYTPSVSFADSFSSRRILENMELGERMIKQTANIVTACRILGSALLLCFPAFSAEFYIIYILCGFTDMVDGTIARMTNSAGQLGAKIDTAADIAFAAASLIKILPAIELPQWLWIWGAAIAIIKISNIICGYVSKKQFIALHTAMNKLAGMLLFLLPLTFSFADVKYTFTLVCAVATFAAIQEGFYILKNKNTDV